jgi:hypothetical protein
MGEIGSGELRLRQAVRLAKHANALAQTRVNRPFMALSRPPHQSESVAESATNYCLTTRDRCWRPQAVAVARRQETVT